VCCRASLQPRRWIKVGSLLLHTAQALAPFALLCRCAHLWSPPFCDPRPIAPFRPHRLRLSGIYLLNFDFSSSTGFSRNDLFHRPRFYSPSLGLRLRARHSSRHEQLDSRGSAPRGARTLGRGDHQLCREWIVCDDLRRWPCEYLNLRSSRTGVHRYTAQPDFSESVVCIRRRDRRLLQPAKLES
jgi:hypothetical protein